MTIKKFLIILLLLISLPVSSKEKNSTSERLEYLNLNWWKNYQDEILIEHLQTLYNNNYDLKIASYKTKQAEENIRLAGANQLPQAGFYGDLSRVLSGPRTQFGNVVIPEYSQNEIFLPLQASYEIDIWGQNYLSRKSAKKQSEITKQEERATYIYLTSYFASCYYNLIKTEELIKNLDKIISTQKQISQMTEKKYNTGLCSINDVYNEKQLLVKYQEDFNKLKENQKTLSNQINTLLALNTDKEITLAKFEDIKYPETPKELASTVIQHRPDLIQSEAYAKKVGIDVKIARREFLPKFILYGNLGFSAYKWNRVFANETFLSNIGIAPSWDIFSGGRKLANYRINKYEYKKAIENYNKTILTSLQEINNALIEAKTTEANLIKSNEYLELEHNKNILTEKQFTIGDASYLDKLKSNICLLQEEQHHIIAKTNRIISTISVYNAVGGIDYTKAENL